MTEEQRAILRRYIQDRVEIAPDTGCWEWSRSLGSHGYGNASVPKVTGERVSVSHRLAYIGFKGQIPIRMHLDHLCKNKRCCNPDHLEAVTQQVNIRRHFGFHEDTTICVRGHAGRMKKVGGHLRCIACIVEKQRDYRARKRAA